MNAKRRSTSKFLIVVYAMSLHPEPDTTCNDVKKVCLRCGCERRLNAELGSHACKLIDDNCTR